MKSSHWFLMLLLLLPAPPEGSAVGGWAHKRPLPLFGNWCTGEAAALSLSIQDIGAWGRGFGPVEGEGIRWIVKDPAVLRVPVAARDMPYLLFEARSVRGEMKAAIGKSRREAMSITIGPDWKRYRIELSGRHPEILWMPERFLSPADNNRESSDKRRLSIAIRSTIFSSFPDVDSVITQSIPLPGETNGDVTLLSGATIRGLIPYPPGGGIWIEATGSVEVDGGNARVVRGATLHLPSPAGGGLVPGTIQNLSSDRTIRVRMRAVSADPPVRDGSPLLCIFARGLSRESQGKLAKRRRGFLYREIPRSRMEEIAGKSSVGACFDELPGASLVQHCVAAGYRVEYGLSMGEAAERFLAVEEARAIVCDLGEIGGPNLSPDEAEPARFWLNGNGPFHPTGDGDVAIPLLVDPGEHRFTLTYEEFSGVAGDVLLSGIQLMPPGIGRARWGRGVRGDIARPMMERSAEIIVRRDETGTKMGSLHFPVTFMALPAAGENVETMRLERILALPLTAWIRGGEIHMLCAGSIPDADAFLTGDLRAQGHAGSGHGQSRR